MMFSRLATTTIPGRNQLQQLARKSVALQQQLPLNLSRGFAVNFDRSKPHVNIGTIGHVRFLGVARFFSSFVRKVQLYERFLH
jgi:hypothetical protein